MSAKHEALAAEAVDWIGALWELSSPEGVRAANPQLLMLLQLNPEIRKHPAFSELIRRRQEQSRDILIKEVVTALYLGEEGTHSLAAALLDFIAEAPDLLGAGAYGLIESARLEARQRVLEIGGDLDPARDVEDVTGEPISVQVLVAPSLFLPPPQGGRHGVMIQRGDEQIASLHFGFPLKQPPERFSITRPWLLGGSWHYAINVYLDRYWPRIAEQLHADAALEKKVLEVQDGVKSQNGPWADWLKSHVNVALKCALSQRVGVPDAAHRAFAKGRGLVIFPWFDQWLKNRPDDVPLEHHLGGLPETMAADQERWVEIAEAPEKPPVAVNLALLSMSTRQAYLVVPDSWPEDAVSTAVAGWRLMPLPVVRFSEWRAKREAGDTAPTIAFGTPASNPLVEEVLTERGLSLDAVEAEAPAIIALSAPGTPRPAWCLAVAVDGPEVASSLRIEMALKQTSSYVICDGGDVLNADRVPLHQIQAF